MRAVTAMQESVEFETVLSVGFESAIFLHPMKIGKELTQGFRGMRVEIRRLLDLPP